MKDILLYAILPPHLKRPIKLVSPENHWYNEKVVRLEKELELSGL